MIEGVFQKIEKIPSFTDCKEKHVVSYWDSCIFYLVLKTNTAERGNFCLHIGS